MTTDEFIEIGMRNSYRIMSGEKYTRRHLRRIFKTEW